MKKTSNNKIIFKNTGLLYMRMLVGMGVSFFTVRVVLDKLGLADYGLYNIVGGVVVMFSFLKTTLTSASQRFFSFTLGKGNLNKMKDIFKTNMLFYAIVCVIVVLLLETVGLWFLNNKLNILPERLEAANWTYQMSIISFVLSTLTVPYESVITSHEKMGFYAYISVLEAVLKLLIAYLLILSPFDKLIMYSLLMTFSSLIIYFIYSSYCHKVFQECSFGLLWDKNKFKEIASYSMWNVVGTTASVVNGEGCNIVLNLFFGTVVNGSRAIVYQILGIATRFATNFFVAVRPRLIILYANGKLEEMHKLINLSAKISFFLIFVISMPILFQLDFVLTLWLGSIPPYVKVFTTLAVVSVLIDSLSNPLITAAQATGNIRTYQITMSVILLLGVPSSYCILLVCHNPNVVFYMSIFISVLSLMARVIILRSLVNLPVKGYVMDVILHVVLSTVISVIIVSQLLRVLVFEASPFVVFIVRSIVIVCTVLLVSFVLGTNKIEKGQLLSFLKKILKRKVV